MRKRSSFSFEGYLALRRSVHFAKEAAFFCRGRTSKKTLLRKTKKRVKPFLRSFCGWILRLLRIFFVRAKKQYILLFPCAATRRHYAGGKKMYWTTFAPGIPQPAWDIGRREANCSTTEGSRRSEQRSAVRIVRWQSCGKVTAFPFPRKAASLGWREDCRTNRR